MRRLESFIGGAPARQRLSAGLKIRTSLGVLDHAVAHCIVTCIAACGKLDDPRTDGAKRA